MHIQMMFTREFCYYIKERKGDMLAAAAEDDIQMVIILQDVLPPRWRAALSCAHHLNKARNLIMFMSTGVEMRRGCG